MSKDYITYFGEVGKGEGRPPLVVLHSSGKEATLVAIHRFTGIGKDVLLRRIHAGLSLDEVTGGISIQSLLKKSKKPYIDTAKTNSILFNFGTPRHD